MGKVEQDKRTELYLEEVGIFTLNRLVRVVLRDGYGAQT